MLAAGLGSTAIGAATVFGFFSTGDTAGPAELAAADAPTITVYKSSTCGCCSKWVDHLQDNGFEVEAIDVVQMAAVKASHGISPDITACHTAEVGSYTIEGHVPADLIRRLLEERPDISGLAVPGMPPGSPGMESPNPKPYHVIAFDDEGGRSVYAER